MEVVVSFADYQLFFFRNVIYLGCYAYLVKLPILDSQNTKITGGTMQMNLNLMCLHTSPPVVGAGMRSYYLLKRLARAHVSLLALTGSGEVGDSL